MQAFYQLLVFLLVTISLVACLSDNCLMYQLCCTDLFLLAIYVDKFLLLYASSESLANNIILQLADKLWCINTGNITWGVLSCVFRRLLTAMWSLNLNQLIKNILTRYEFDQLWQSLPPMIHDLELTSDDCPITDVEQKRINTLSLGLFLSCLPWLQCK